MIQCKKCIDIIESVHRHDFKWCSCKSIYIDGGRDYQRVGFVGVYDEVIETDPEKFMKCEIVNNRKFFYNPKKTILSDEIIQSLESFDGNDDSYSFYVDESQGLIIY